MNKADQDFAKKPAGIYNLDEPITMEDSYEDAFSLHCRDGVVYLELADNQHGDPTNDLALDGGNVTAIHAYLTQVLEEGSA